jgi:hypothetical protein
MGIYIETDADENPETQSGIVIDQKKCISDLEYIFQQRALFTSNIHLADQKSGYIAILHGVLIGGISSLMQNNEILIKLTYRVDRWIYILAMTMLFLSFAANMLAFIPRISRSPSGDTSWTGIADGDDDLIVRTISTESYPARMKRITAQVKALAKICNHKFEYIKYSIIFLGLSTAGSMILYLRLVFP